MFLFVYRHVGGLFSASIGGLAHEMGHIFDLGHTEGGLMGNQYHRIDLCLTPVVSYPKSVVHVCSVDEEHQIRPKVCLPNGHLAEDCVSFSFSCATLLFFHRLGLPLEPSSAGSCRNFIAATRFIMHGLQATSSFIRVHESVSKHCNGPGYSH